MHPTPPGFYIGRFHNFQGGTARDEQVRAIAFLETTDYLVRVPGLERSQCDRDAKYIWCR